MKPHKRNGRNYAARSFLERMNDVLSKNEITFKISLGQQTGLTKTCKGGEMMKRKLLIGLTAILVLAFAVPAFATFNGFTDAQKKNISNYQKQMVELRKKMVDEYVSAGQITADQAKVIKDNMDKAQKYREDNGIIGGPGMGGRGCGGAGGFGQGACGNAGLGGGCGILNNANQTTNL